MSLSYNDLESAPFSTSLDLPYPREPLLTETEPDARSTGIDDGAKICAICSSFILPPLPPPSPQTAPPPPPPSPQPVTSHPRKWYEIPQTHYSHGRKQRGYISSESVFFQVDGSPGVNMGDAFRKRFAGLEGQDDPVLQHAKMAICCRLLVRFSC